MKRYVQKWELSSRATSNSVFFSRQISYRNHLLPLLLPLQAKRIYQTISLNFRYENKFVKGWSGDKDKEWRSEKTIMHNKSCFQRYHSFVPIEINIHRDPLMWMELVWSCTRRWQTPANEKTNKPQSTISSCLVQVHPNYVICVWLIRDELLAGFSWLLASRRRSKSWCSSWRTRDRTI